MLMGEIGLLVLIDRWVGKLADRPGSGSLSKNATALKTQTIGYPEGLRFLDSLRSQKLLEAPLEPWDSASAGEPTPPPPSCLLAAVSEGQIEFCGGGGTASIISQAAQQLFVRVAREKYPDLQGEAILVPEDSAIQQLHDRRGRRIGFDEGSSAHDVLIRTLQTVGLSSTDIQPLPLPLAEALTRFREDELDAWVVWMPYAPTPARGTYRGRSIADLCRILADQAAAEAPTRYDAIHELVRDSPHVLKALLEKFNEAVVLLNRQQFEEALDQNRAHALEPDMMETRDQHTLKRSILPIDEPTLRSLEYQSNVCCPTWA